MKQFEQLPVKLLSQEPIDVKHSFIEWDEKYIRYCVEMTAEQWKNTDDETMGKEIVQIYFDRYALKSQIVGLEKCWNIATKKWVIYIFINGMGEDWRLYFNKQSACDERLQQLIEYIFCEKKPAD